MARVSLLPVFCAREGLLEVCVAGSRSLLCREDYIVPCVNTQRPPAGGSGCFCGESGLDIMLFPTAWVFPVDDAGNAKYWSVVVSDLLSPHPHPPPLPGGGFLWGKKVEKVSHSFFRGGTCMQQVSVL